MLKLFAVVKAPPSVNVFPPPVRVISLPVTVNVRGVVPPARVYPSVALVSVNPLYVPPVTTPAVVTVNALFPMTNADPGAVFPIPTLPVKLEFPDTVKAFTGAVVPIPRFPAKPLSPAPSVWIIPDVEVIFPLPE